jgi:iron(III) transport system substrate-binding protein
MAVADAMGEQKTLDLFRRIVATNGMSVRKGHTLLANLVPSGEVPMALTVYGYMAEQLSHSGAPVEPLYLQPPVALPTAIAVARKAPDPSAAVLFWEYFLTDGQKILLTQDNTPSNFKVKAPPPGLIFINAAKLLDEGDRWTKLYKEIFVNRAK